MADYRNYSEDRTKKRCHLCQQMVSIELYRFKEKKNGKFRNNVCKPCDAAYVARYRHSPVGIAAEFVRRSKYFCRINDLPFDLDKKWVLDTLEAQNWCCALTKLPMAFKEIPKRGFTWNSISMDRIRHKDGYTKDNVRFVLNAVNLFRNDGPDDRMYMIAEALVANRRKNDERKSQGVGDGRPVALRRFSAGRRPRCGQAL
jgi:hypothetical protein